MTIQNPHRELGLKTMKNFKEISNTLEGWKFVSEKDGVKIYSMSDSTGFDLVRGDYILKDTNFTAKQVATVANTFGTKAVWDPRNDAAEIKAWYNENEGLYWGRIKTPWPITNRDTTTAFLRDYISDDETYTVLYSVEDSRAPATSSNVRAHIYQVSWKFFKTDGGIGITYVTQFDLAGSIPAAFMKTVNLENPLCAGKVAKYVKDFGFPPYSENYSAGCIQKRESFDHSKKEFVIELEGTGSANVFISKKMYPSGVKVKVSGKAKHQVDGDKIAITDVNGSTTIKISKA